MFKTIYKTFCTTSKQNKIDPYQILGVDKNVTKEDLKKAYYKLAKQYHPDVYKGKDIIFQQINEAYDILSNDQNRQEFESQTQSYQSRHHYGYTKQNKTQDTKNQNQQYYYKADYQNSSSFYQSYSENLYEQIKKDFEHINKEKPDAKQQWQEFQKYENQKFRAKIIIFPFLLLILVALIEIAPKIIRQNDNEVVIFDEKTNNAYIIDKQTFHNLNKKL